MERLTNHFNYCDFIDCKYRNAELAKANQCDFFNMTSMDKCHDKKVYEKLRELEDLEEQGLLLKLPLAKEDAFWEINRGTTPPSYYKRYAHSYQHCVYVLERLGKTCFLTKAEAEKALEEMEK